MERICLSLGCKIGDIVQIIKIDEPEIEVAPEDNNEPVVLDSVACEEYGLSEADQEIVHFYQENKRVQRQAQALREGDFETFLRLVTESGRSSWMYLQNITPAGAIEHQDVAVALALCDTLLQGRGAYRVHGGGFAGTVQAFVPLDMLDDFKTETERVLGKGKCHVLSIRSEGGIRVEERRTQ